MNVNLADAINRTREKAKTLKQRAIELRENKHPIFSHVANDVVADNYLERAEYNEQLASWLEELKERREEECPFTWGGNLDNKEIIRLIREHMRIHSKKEPLASARLNKAFLIAIEKLEADRWIPVSERLPNTLGVYNVTRKIIEGETSYVISDACYFDGQNTWHADTGVNHGRPYITDVIAWKPKPEPYESEAPNEQETVKI